MDRPKATVRAAVAAVVRPHRGEAGAAWESPLGRDGGPVERAQFQVAPCQDGDEPAALASGRSGRLPAGSDPVRRPVPVRVNPGPPAGPHARFVLRRFSWDGRNRVPG
ncbi:hypothetical protein GCM10012287_15050 [Streptomyces daqingensis]|uniref:Uncharacterized protein n=1 Tax=Streptomyces daqingensis TaxID=1472640 RepID=A0ABQ2M264_9ACTN|nr:hypothetical protein GCM10012287_15050 [Streptomyces daqingensis]